jgi:RNA polymerase sigma-70 factor (ECF subfamily)
MNNQNSDLILIKEYLNGNKKALEKIYLKYKKPLFNLIWCYVNNIEDTEDLFQTVFEKLIKNIHKYKPQKNSQFKTYLFKIAINSAKDFLRKKKLLKFIKLENVKKIGEEDKNMEIIENSDIMQFLKNEIMKLPAKYRDVIILIYQQNLKYSEVSKILGKPIGTIKFRVNYAISLLKKRLNKGLNYEK